MYRRRNSCLWPCSLAVPVLAGWVYVFCGFMYRNVILVCGRVPWLYQYWPGGFMLFVVLCTGDVILVCGRVPWLYQYWPGGFMFLW